MMQFIHVEYAEIRLFIYAHMYTCREVHRQKSFGWEFPTREDGFRKGCKATPPSWGEARSVKKFIHVGRFH